MKIPVMVIALAGVTLIAGCGNGSPNDPATSVSTTNASANESANPSVNGPTNAPTLASTPPLVAGDGNSNGLPAAAAMSIDPPSPPIAMSAGVTVTIDPPNPASAPVITLPPPTDDTTSVAAQQLTPVVHYPPDPSGTDD